VLLVVLDQRTNSSCSTGRFELIYRATTNPNTRGSDSKFISNTRGSDNKFVVAGQKINRVDLQRFVAIDRKMMRQQQQHENDVIVTSSSAAGGCHAPQYGGHRISLVQVTDGSVTDHCGCDGQDTFSPSEVPHNNANASVTTTTSSSQTSERPAVSSQNKVYRGLRPSTVQIYNGR